MKVSASQVSFFWLLLVKLLTRVLASEKCQQEKRKTVNGEDILFAMTSLGFENYAEALKIYLSKYREVRTPNTSFTFPAIVQKNLTLTGSLFLDPVRKRREPGPATKQWL